MNGRVMEAGDKVETFTLEKIAPSHIVLTGEGRRIRIELP
ncbi:MAG: hypothetical protein ACE5EG_12715 [Thermoanaerobaculia bacterium]